jgi:AAA+ ATPase superfamily predicted ATPase
MIKIDYICTGIDNIKDFFGRQKLIDEINHRLKSGGSISLYGERKIGKTSLLKYFYQFAIREIPLPDVQQVILVFQTFAGKQDKSPGSFLKLLYDDLKRQMNLPEEIEKMDSIIFENLISSFYHEGKRFIFFFDEIDAASGNNQFDHNFFSYLRSLAEMYKVQYITASRKSIKQLIKENNVVSPFNGLFSGNVFKLEVFAEDDAYRFCEKLSKEAMAGDTISAASIIALAGGHPFLIRLAYYHAVNLIMQSRNNRLDYDKLKLKFEKESFYAYFYDVWSHMDIDERKLLKKVSMEDVKDKLKLSQREMLENFLDNGLVLKEKNGCYSLVNSYFRELVHEWEVDGTQPEVSEKPTAFDNEVFTEKLQRVEKSFAPPGKDAEEKGKAIEEMAAYLFTSYKHYFDVRQQVQSRTSQLDIHLWFKPGDDPLLRKFGEEIIVECKNWQNPVGKPEINDLAGDMVNRKCKTGILISRKGITGKDFKDANGQRLVWFHSEFNLIILVLSFEDMKKIEAGKNLIVLLKEKYQELVEG